MTLTSGKAASALGVNRYTFRTWCRLGLITAPQHSLVGWRCWGEPDIPQLIEQITAILASKKYEKRSANAIREQLLRNWLGYVTDQPQNGSHPEVICA